MEKIRSFIAIELPQEVKSALAGLQKELKAAANIPVKWVEPGNMHLTLQFLGDIDSGIIGKITTVIQEVTSHVPPFEIEIKGLGVFPGSRRVRVIWVGLAGDLEKLEQVQKNIEESLVPLGFPAEGRPFSPHLTLARVHEYTTPGEMQRIGQLISSTPFNESYIIPVKAVNLMKSQLTREGPIYTIISPVPLK